MGTQPSALIQLSCYLLFRKNCGYHKNARCNQLLRPAVFKTLGGCVKVSFMKPFPKNAQYRPLCQYKTHRIPSPGCAFLATGINCPVLIPWPHDRLPDFDRQFESRVSPLDRHLSYTNSGDGKYIRREDSLERAAHLSRQSVASP
ncbi:hypothetical protein SAMN02745220_02810 [Desulfopila aestuarii DSM 18488]|uniref:Uncharacterized protein n=1 Tax=Desulfopila aestuarii DSM 18488 TaxID=1121416 RepID=A0A1M7Y9Y7_9BACT|nr:hypothetical protein SAMN02745220_02810 [Desulfopila aestuarii DSM 18488]